MDWAPAFSDGPRVSVEGDIAEFKGGGQDAVAILASSCRGAYPREQLSTMSTTGRSTMFPVPPSNANPRTRYCLSHEGDPSACYARRFRCSWAGRRRHPIHDRTRDHMRRGE